MTPEERDIIGRFIARVGGAPQSGFNSGSSVPATTQATLPAIDPDADRFINDQFNANPQARYRITQMAFVQEAALAEAQNRIKRLEYDLQQAQQALQQAQTQGGQRSGGLFGGLFGGGQQARAAPAYQPQYAPPPPQPSYPPGYQPGMFRSGGSGFLGSALTTAAGVAGGVLAADALTSMFSGHGMGGGFGGGGFGGGGFGGGEVVNETVVNNYGDGAPDPWAGGGTAPDAPSGDWTGGGGGGSDPWAGGGAAPDSGWSGGGGDSGGDWGGGGDGGGGWDDSGGGGGDGGF